jgi:hypothetical protein
MTIAERAVSEILSAWGVACNSAEWTECVEAVERALAAREREIVKAVRDCVEWQPAVLDEVLSAIQAGRRAWRAGSAR